MSVNRHHMLYLVLPGTGLGAHSDVHVAFMHVPE